ncbi:uncharacterized protein K460DRAFT_150321 [Cucurbitaria berberidis CBS 394.84]|uniref:Uncharacterized protein n=1 Tax=Cucurbitaria berberidis CBS 394.84 TaxID=1168544 RepID=A0A9P4GD57_9PLEO|nr:uncharacterized protein K460DRAFT_150321 [Cucurbitaria berberidis CBS 394.84]KAF1843733.1 hypothetical protein K460DRAFT_150321 [Cucurbitaria berberidis CBS 394.84]
MLRSYSRTSIRVSPQGRKKCRRTCERFCELREWHRTVAGIWPQGSKVNEGDGLDVAEDVRVYGRNSGRRDTLFRLSKEDKEDLNGSSHAWDMFIARR